MRRSRFLQLSALSLPALACGIPAASPLQDWMHRFSAKADSDGRGLLLKASIAPRRLGEALHALDAVADCPLHCEGAIIRGSIDGERFCLRFA